MDTNTYNYITIDTYTDICPILVGRVLPLTHLGLAAICCLKKKAHVELQRV